MARTHHLFPVLVTNHWHCPDGWTDTTSAQMA